MEIGIYTFAELRGDSEAGVISPEQRLRNLLEEIELADQVGLDVFGVGEHHRPDFAVSAPVVVLAAAAERTRSIRLTSAVSVLGSDDPVRVFQDFATLDLLSGGRFLLGLGTSGPQVVEGWYGRPFAKPLARTREVVDIVRQVLARQGPVVSDGPHHPLPYDGADATGMGKALKPIVHPLRADVPIWLGAEGPRNVAQTAEIADGWIPLFYTPGSAHLYRAWLDEGFARPGARRQRADFEIAASCHLQVVPDAAEKDRVVQAMKPTVALYMGGMGAKEQNFHKQVFERMGHEALADEVQELYLAGQKDRAAALVPDSLVHDLHIVGEAGEVREKVSQWEETGVTTLLLSLRTADEVRRVADVVL